MATLATGVWTALQIVVIVLAADLVGGLFHWAEDTLGDVDTPIWGHIVRPNVLHHARPAAMMEINWLRSNAVVLAVAALIAVALWLADALTWQWTLLLVLAGFNQQAHRFTHTPTDKLPLPAKWLQRLKLLQTARHHWQHHRPPHLTHYCVLTPWLNPVLDQIGFWRGLERMLVPVLGAPRRPDLVMPGRQGGR